MAVPVYVGTSGFGTDAGGDWAFSGAATVAGRLMILHVLQDGSTSGAVALTGATHIEDLAGTDNQWTYIGAFAVGNPTAAYNHLWIGRTIDTSAWTASGTNSTSEDLYFMAREFSGVAAGTTLATVIENGTAGSTANGVGTSNTAADTGVTTLGTDRLALNFLGINDDNPAADFTGETGGDWTLANSNYAEASGTDGAVYLYTAPMTSAGTINGATASITDSDAWGVVGFALIPVPSGPTTYEKAGWALLE